MADKKELLKEISRIQKMSKPKMWRAAKDFAIENNPALQEEEDLLMEEIKEIKENLINPQAISEGGTMRWGLRIPDSIVSAIRAFDPEFLIVEKNTKGKPNATNKYVRQLMKVFPEYRIPKEI